MTSIKSP